MIELHSHTAILLYLGGTLFVLFGVWLSYHFTHKKKKIIPPEVILFLCEYCHFLYTHPPGISVTQCPQCKSYNKSNQYKKKV